MTKQKPKDQEMPTIVTSENEDTANLNPASQMTSPYKTIKVEGQKGREFMEITGQYLLVR
jgi:hypothetical protein